eukprot:GHRR01010668.1.p1 GENE.GHRR01010668.1~~GHRR01010668.1.p1  ORF type:complete len:477 (+),score=164.03 GHRR01010668.1:440-1870(+)
MAPCADAHGLHVQFEPSWLFISICCVYCLVIPFLHESLKPICTVSSMQSGLQRHQLRPLSGAITPCQQHTDTTCVLHVPMSFAQASVSALAQEIAQLEAKRQLLARQELPALTEDLARLNDTYIVAGDYERQLHKMVVASERKQAVLRSLLNVTSRHWMLLLLGSQEQQRLLMLTQELQQCQAQLKGHVVTTQARIHRCTEVRQALQAAQQSSNLQPNDTYLLALLAAANGTLDTSQASTATTGNDRQPGGSENPVTPAGWGMRMQNSPISLMTPGYATVNQLTDKLQQLADRVQKGSSQIQQLLQDMPQQLDEHTQAARQLHLLVFPPGQVNAPIVTSNAPTGKGGSSIWGPASSVGTSAPASIRSRHSGTSSATNNSLAQHSNHPMPALRVPEVAEAQETLETSCKQLEKDVYRLVMKQNEHAKVLSQRKKDQDLERNVMAMFYNQPEALVRQVAAVRAEVQALELASHLGLQD